MFAAEFETVTVNPRRLVTRLPVGEGMLAEENGLDRALCHVVSITRYSARLQTYLALKPGTTIWLTMPLIGRRLARVGWADDFEAGCAFVEPIAPKELAVLVALSPETGIPWMTPDATPDRVALPSMR